MGRRRPERMLETVRESCVERLAESGERVRLEAAHATPPSSAA